MIRQFLKGMPPGSSARLELPCADGHRGGVQLRDRRSFSEDEVQTRMQKRGTLRAPRRTSSDTLEYTLLARRSSQGDRETHWV